MRVIEMQRYWTKPRREFQIVTAEPEELIIHLVDYKMGDLFRIKCLTTMQFIEAIAWNDVQWMLFISGEKLRITE